MADSWYLAIPVMGWSIDPSIHGLLYGPGNLVCIPTNYGEVFYTDAVT